MAYPRDTASPTLFTAFFLAVCFDRSRGPAFCNQLRSHHLVQRDLLVRVVFRLSAFRWLDSLLFPYLWPRMVQSLQASRGPLWPVL